MSRENLPELKYCKPRLHPLLPRDDKTFGDCTSGSGDVNDCATGNLASKDCVSGGAPVGNCTVGTGL